MSDVVIRVDHLGKQYRIGQRKPYHSLRESLLNAVKAPFHRMVGSRKVLANIEEEFWALKDVSFEIKQGDVVGIIGRNGAGKSTLLKILSQITEPTKGEVLVDGRVGSLLEVGTGFHPELTGRENIYLNGAILGMSRWEIRKKMDGIVSFAELEQFLDTPVKHYSSGMYVRLGFAVAAHLEPDILIVDEVLAVGDMQFQQKCLGRMSDVARNGRTVLFVSHNLGSVSVLCSRAILLNKGRIIKDGTTEATLGEYLKAVQTNERYYSEGPVTRASIHQRGKSLEAELDFRMPSPIRFPCLGIVISESNGVPLFGTNAKVAGASPPGAPMAEGTARVVVNQPKLRDGQYRASLWFGDGEQDVYEEKEALVFEVAGMADGPRVGSALGAVCPECSFIFTDPGKQTAIPL